MKKGIFVGLALLAGLLIGGYATWQYSNRWFERQTEERATVLLQEIQKVAKLVSVEGQFSEIYDYKDFRGYDISMFRKKALLRIQARVSMGFDLSNMDIRTDAATKTVFLQNLPEPEIFSIDHDVDYYDITEGTFNYFTERDYTALNDRAKNLIRQRAEQSDLRRAAIEQGEDLLELIEFLVESMGWRVEYTTVTPNRLLPG